MRLLDRHIAISSLAVVLTLSAPLGCAPAYGGDPLSEDDEGAPSRGESSKASPASGASSPDESSSSPSPSGPQTTDLYHSAKGNMTDQAVVYIHGGPGANSKMFELTVQEAIAKLGYYVVAYDQRGSARSPQGTAKDFSYAKSTQDLDDLIGALNLKSPILLGHSFGGSIALHYLDRFKGKAKGAVVVSSPMSFPETYDTTLTQCASRYRMWGRMSDASQVDALRGTMFPHGVQPPFLYSDANIDSVIQCQSGAMLYFPAVPTKDDLSFGLAHGSDTTVTAVNPAVGSGFQANDQVGYADNLPLLAAHKSEVRGIYAPSWDAMFSKSQLAAIQARVTQFATVDGAGHFVFMDQPKAFVSKLGEVLAAMK